MHFDNSANPAFSSDCRADQKANGGMGSISEQIAASRVDVVLGGGAVHFDQPAEGDTRSVRDLAAANGYRVVGTAAELDSLARGTRVLGLFSRGTMPVQWRGEGDAVATLAPPRPDGGPRVPPPFACEPNPGFAGMPRLREMAAAALKQLDDGRSFALMIESASIDKQSHLRRPCGQIGEVAQLEETLELLLDYQRAHPETLVLVTADHGQAAQLVPETSWLGGAARPGHFARLRTREGALIGVNYATNDSDVQEDHTGVTIPLLASGPGALELPAFVQQRDIFRIMVDHLGLRAPPLAD
jgi:alkaline phosphatase